MPIRTVGLVTCRIEVGVGLCVMDECKSKGPDASSTGLRVSTSAMYRDREEVRSPMRWIERGRGGLQTGP